MTHQQSRYYFPVIDDHLGRPDVEAMLRRKGHEKPQSMIHKWTTRRAIAGMAWQDLMRLAEQKGIELKASYFNIVDREPYQQ